MIANWATPIRPSTDRLLLRRLQALGIDVAVRQAMGNGLEGRDGTTELLAFAGISGGQANYLVAQAYSQSVAAGKAEIDGLLLSCLPNQALLSRNGVSRPRHLPLFVPGQAA